MNYTFSRIVSVLALAALFACTSEAQEKPPTPSGEFALSPAELGTAKIQLSEVQLRTIDETVETSGRITFDDLRVSHVFSPVTGRVTRILASPGERLKKGAPLAVIESPDVGSAFSDLDKAQADWVAAEHDFNRQKELYAAHAAAEKDLESSEDGYRKAQAELARAQEKAKLLRSGTVDRVSQQYVLRALIDGEVIARTINPGVEVQGQYSGGTAQELFSIGEIDQVWAMADLFDVDLSRVKKGATVQVSVAAYPGKSFPGTVDWISDTLDPATRSVKVRCVVPNPEHLLKPEMYASVAIQASATQALAVPRSAVLRLGDQTVVFVKTTTGADGRVHFERRPVTVDEDRGDTYAPVLHGLVAGEQVVGAGAILLSEMGAS